MTRYIPTSSNAVAVGLSSALWDLSRPTAVRAANEVTTALFGVVTCLNGSVWMQADTTFDIPVHPDVELGDIASILQPWIDAGHLPADTITQLAALIESKRGQHLVVYDAFPQLFKDMSKTHEQMIAAGLLAEPDMP
jgi:hypothetical protein